MLSDQHRKMLQRLQSDPAWAGFEAFYQDFMLRRFALMSQKRDTEFDTLWYMAASEGGKAVMQEFVKELEEEAGKVDIL